MVSGKGTPPRISDDDDNDLIDVDDEDEVIDLEEGAAQNDDDDDWEDMAEGMRVRAVCSFALPYLSLVQSETMSFSYG